MSLWQKTTIAIACIRYCCRRYSFPANRWAKQNITELNGMSGVKITDRTPYSNKLKNGNMRVYIK